MKRRLAICTLPLLAVTCCRAIPQPAPLPPAPVVTAPTPTPTPTSPPPVIAEPVYENWLDAPQTPGDWLYEKESNESFALFAVDIGNPIAALRCDLRTGEVSLGRFANTARTAIMQIRTETAMRTAQAQPKASRQPVIAADFRSSDPILDAIALSRGRFALGVEGQRTLYLPAWPELTRVIEDCR